MPPKRKAAKSCEDQPKEKRTFIKAVDDAKESADASEPVEVPSDSSFASSAKTPSGSPWTKKFASLNVNGIRAWLKKDGTTYIKAENADFVCIQETKCDVKSIPRKELEDLGYKTFWLNGDKDGYSGTGLLSKLEPLSVKYGLGIDEHDKEGRVITAEFDHFYLISVYVPNSGRGLVRLDYRTKSWDDAFRTFAKELAEKKPVIIGGDMNVAHEEIDLKHPKPNRNKVPGFCDAEREQLTNLLNAGFIDSFRHLYPKQADAYTFWSFMSNARAKNVGWRLDYFVISDALKDKLCDSLIRKDVMGSDHCPVVLLLAI